MSPYVVSGANKWVNFLLKCEYFLENYNYVIDIKWMNEWTLRRFNINKW